MADAPPRPSSCLPFALLLAVLFGALAVLYPLRSAPSARIPAAGLSVAVYDNGDFEAPRFAVLSPETCRVASDVQRRLLAAAELRDEEATAYAADGRPLTDCGALLRDAVAFVVPRGRPYQHAPRFVGFRQALDHVRKGLALETLSLRPAVFRVTGFFDATDVERLKESAMAQTDARRKLQRSTTGSNAIAVSMTRTSETAFDTGSPVAHKLKRRCFELLGMRPYDEKKADGLQLLRYNVSAAYNSHFDFIEDTTDPAFNWHPDRGGANRFATLLLYLSDVEEGGETVFPRTTEPKIKIKEDVVAALREGPHKDLFKRNSWEERLVGQCGSRLSAKPRLGEALLFYNQLPTGARDDKSIHGACPVLRGQKWAANLWVWNDIRYGHAGKPAEKAEKLRATFVNKSDQPVQLVWVSPQQARTSFGIVEPGTQRAMDTFPKHVFEMHAADAAKDALGVNTRLESFEIHSATTYTYGKRD